MLDTPNPLTRNIQFVSEPVSWGYIARGLGVFSIRGKGLVCNSSGSWFSPSRHSCGTANRSYGRKAVCVCFNGTEGMMMSMQNEALVLPVLFVRAGSTFLRVAVEDSNCNTPWQACKWQWIGRGVWLTSARQHLSKPHSLGQGTQKLPSQ